MALFDWTPEDEPPARPSGRGRLAVGAGVVLAAGAVLVALAVRAGGPASPDPAEAARLAAIAARPATGEEVARACSGCHPTPPPDSFARADWRDEVWRGFQFLNKSTLPPGPAGLESVVAYYEAHAPERLPDLDRGPAPAAPLGVAFDPVGYSLPGSSGAFGVAHARFVRLLDPKRLDVLACDMIEGVVLVARPYEPSRPAEVLAEGLRSPSHAEVVDLDRDGVLDVVVAELGEPRPTELKLGRVTMLRGSPGGRFAPIVLEAGLGRVADVRAADFDGDGDLDLIVAVFGWNTVGEVRYLENRTVDRDRPAFVGRTVDPRHGAIDVPVADLDGDGRPDFVALFGQETESVVAFLNRGDGTFRPETIYRAPHPAYGSSGIELVDLDKDGDLDVVYASGDSLDSSALRPYNGLHWLENRGSYPFEPRRLASAYGVYRPKTADLDGDGDLDIVATSLLVGPGYRPRRDALAIDSILVLEQTRPGEFARHALETVRCDHATSDLADYDGDGRVDLVTGNFSEGFPGPPPRSSPRDRFVVRRNLGRPAPAPASVPVSATVPAPPQPAEPGGSRR